MRKLYLFLIVVSALTAVFAFMGASANAFEWYESRNEQERMARTGERVPARIIDKRVVRQEHASPSGSPMVEEQHRIYVEIQKGARAGEVVWEAASRPQYQQLSVGTQVDLLVSSDQIRIIELGYPAGSSIWLFLGIAISAALACAGLVYHVRRMPIRH